MSDICPISYRLGAEAMLKAILQTKCHFPKGHPARRSGELAIAAFKEAIRDAASYVSAPTDEED